ncbi:MAG: endonuclease/exonuclease/phosphatase family protein [Candidatus Nanosalina sp.]
MKILSINAGYFLGYRGTHLDYLRNPWKSFLGSPEEESNLGDLIRMIETEDPDHVLVQEVDCGSFRSNFGGQEKYLEDKSPEKFRQRFGRKYRGRIFPKLPIFRFMGNSVLYSAGEIVNHRLDIGRKNLVQEIRLGDLSIFSLHLATFSSRIRRKQLEEIETLAERREDYVLAGDLNFHKGREEINALERQLGQRVRSPGKTFPASKPSEKLDLVTSSKGLKITDIEELGNCFSDHRPIIFNVEKT